MNNQDKNHSDDPTKKKTHRRGRRGSRRRSTSSDGVADDPSPALQSIQDIISEIKRLPNMGDDTQRTRHHSVPAIMTANPEMRAADDMYLHLPQPLALDPLHPTATSPSPDKEKHSPSWSAPVTSRRTRSFSVPHHDRGVDKHPLAPHQTPPHPHQLPPSQPQRRMLYPPHIPLPEATQLLLSHQLFSGVLAIDAKDSSDAYVHSDELGEAIYIYGSRNRNRALDGDIVAVELVDVDTMLMEKSAKKQARRRQSLASSLGSLALSSIPEHSAVVQTTPTERPKYCGRVVCILERPKHMLFSGTLLLQRPSSIHQQQPQQDEDKKNPKIVWLVPADKKLPLVAVPVKHAPSGFVRYHEEYKNRIFIGNIQRWPATSLHPFGIVEREIGWMGELHVHSRALMADNHLKDDDFADSARWSLNNIPKPVATDDRLDLRDQIIYTISDENDTVLDQALSIKPVDKHLYEVGIHVPDIASLVPPNSPLDREAKDRGVLVNLVERQVPLFPPQFCAAHASFLPNQDRLALSVLCRVTKSGTVLHTWIGKTVVRSHFQWTFEQADAQKNGPDDRCHLAILFEVCRALQEQRIKDGGHSLAETLTQFDLNDSGYPTTIRRIRQNDHDPNILLQELTILANKEVAQKISSRFPDQAVLCRQPTASESDRRSSTA